MPLWHTTLPTAWAQSLPACMIIRTSANCSAVQGRADTQVGAQEPCHPRNPICLGVPKRGDKHFQKQCRARAHDARHCVESQGAHQGCTATSLGLPKTQRGTTCTGRRQERMVLAAPLSASSAAMSIPACMPACVRLLTQIRSDQIKSDLLQPHQAIQMLITLVERGVPCFHTGRHIVRQPEAHLVC